MNRPLVGWSAFASIASILFGLLLVLANVSSRRMSEWGDAIPEMLPQAVLIAGGLIALAIVSTDSKS